MRIIILLFLFALCSCDEEPSGGDGDVEVEGDADVAAIDDADSVDSDVEADVDAVDDTDVDIEDDVPWRCVQDDAPDVLRFRMTSIRFHEPETLAHPLLQSPMDEVVDELRFVWLMTLDMTNETLTIGSGLTVSSPADRLCTAIWNPDERFASVSAPIVIEDGVIYTPDLIPPLIIPAYTESSPTENPSFQLPIKSARLVRMVLSDDLRVVGRPNPDSEPTWEYANTWQLVNCDDESWCRDDLGCGGGSCYLHLIFEGWITVDDALVVYISELGGRISLCGLLAGLTTSRDCTAPMEDWDSQPVEIPDRDEMGWRLQIVGGAGAVTIRNES